MRVTIAAIYGVAMWIAIVTYVAVDGGAVRYVVFACPLIVSGSMCMILAVDYAMWKTQGWLFALYDCAKR